MRMEEIRNLPKEDIVSLLEICRRDMRFMDGFWFMNVEDTWGIEKAIEIDASIWHRFGKYEAQLLAKAFKWDRKGIPTLVTALKLAPSWLFFDYTVEQLSDTEATFQVTKCLPQTARLSLGRGIFACSEVDKGFLTSFAQVIDPRIKVEREFSPPDKYFDNLWCSWRFYIGVGENPC